jgi:choline-sulfatase
MIGPSRRRALQLLLVMLFLLDIASSRSLIDSAQPANIILITLDTTRADRLSPYGLMNVQMPALDRLAREGVVFDQAMTVAPLTLPAHASLFTGLFPPSIRVRDNASEPLAPEFTTLAELLRSRSYRTGAAVGSIVVSASRGLAQGFDFYGEPRSGLQRPADEVMNEALGWLDAAADRPFFLWAHLYDPHRPYSPPEPFRSAHADPYIGEIAFADAQIARLLTWIDTRGLSGRTIVVVAGDHGEALGEHGERDHGVLLYQSVLRVPLIMRVPGLRPGRVNDVVRLVDIMPTLLSIVGAEAPQSDGVSLLRILTGEPTGPRELEAYAESEYGQQLGCPPRRALRERRYKLIEGERVELFDLDRDPFEQHNLVDRQTSIVAAMAARLDAIARAPSFPVSTKTTAARDHAARLAALGYIGGPAKGTLVPARPQSANTCRELLATQPIRVP